MRLWMVKIMANSINLSICIPVYNQSQMVADCVSEILKYPDDDIEVIINDDCSTENIEQLISSFNDFRLKYFRNDVNLGHDLNILASFKNASTPFCFLLRVRDRLLHESISNIISCLKNKNVVYLTGNAIDETGQQRLEYKKQIVKSKDALAFHFKLYSHPSGSLYNISNLDLNLYEQFIKDNIHGKYGFMVHDMLRMDLSQRGDFALINDVNVWQYTITTNSTDIAVNSGKNNTSVFSPIHVKERFLFTFKWAHQCVKEKNRLYCYKQIIKRYFYLDTWGFKSRNENPELQRHYNYMQVDFDIVKERLEFEKITKQIISDECNLFEARCLNYYMKKTSFNNKFWGFIYFYLARFMKNTFYYNIHQKIKVKRGRT